MSKHIRRLVKAKKKKNLCLYLTRNYNSLGIRKGDKVIVLGIPKCVDDYYDN